MNSLDYKQIRQKLAKTGVQPKKFDERLGMALSDSTVFDDKLGNKDLQQNNIQDGNLINQEYFQNRISRELSLLKRNQKNPKVLTRVGDIYFANLKFPKAKSFFNRAFQENTDNIVVANKLAHTYMVMGKLDQADKVLNLVKSKKDNNTLHTHAIIKMTLNLLDDSEHLIKQIPSKSRNFHEAINTLGLINLIRGDYSGAEKCFKRSTKDKEDYIPAQSNLAIAYQSLDKIDEAVEQYNKVLAMAPDYLVAYNNLFSLLVKNERIQEAYDVMAAAKHLGNSENDIQFRLGWAQMRLGNFESAIKEYEKVLDLLPENSNTLNNIGFCYALLNDAPNALNALERALRKDQNNIIAIKNLMELHEALRQTKESRRLAHRLLQLAPSEPDATTFIADELAEKEEWDKAIKLYERAYSAKPRWISLYIGMTHIYADILPNLAKGVDAAKYAIDNKLPGYEKLYNNLIHLYLVNDKLDLAEEWLSRLTDDTPINLATLGLYNLKKNNLSEAKKLYARAAKKSNDRTQEALVIQREHFDLGEYFSIKGDTKRALEEFKSILRMKNSGYKYVHALAIEKLRNLEDNKDQP